MEKNLIQIIFLFSLYIFLHFDGVGAVFDCNVEPRTLEGRLRKRLFCNYDRTSRPISSTGNGPTIIKMRLIVKAFNFDASENRLSISSWLAMSWTDDNLKWSTSQFNLNTITASGDTIWMPDLALYNSDISSSHNEFCKVANCVISQTGTVSCIPPCSHAARCEPDYKRWPFDKQNCTLHIGTWVNSGDEIDFRAQKVVISDTELSSQSRMYRLIRATHRRNPGNYTGTVNTYPSLTYTFLIERHSDTLSSLFLVPALVLVIINLISLWVEPENFQRLVLLSVSAILNFLICQQLSYDVPPNAEITPDIIVYFRDFLLSTGILMLITVILRGIASCNSDMPGWIDSATIYIGSNKIGQALLRENLLDKQPLTSENGTDDSINLVESQANAEKLPNNSKPWQIFAKTIDRLLFIILGLLYIFMILDLIPEGFFDEKIVKEVEIGGV